VNQFTKKALEFLVNCRYNIYTTHNRRETMIDVDELDIEIDFEELWYPEDCYCEFDIELDNEGDR